MKYKDFYSELGKLLYAVADIDKVITQQEKKALENIVKIELVPFEKHTDNFGTDVAFYTEMEFNFLDEEIADPVAAFNSFVDYVEEHHTALNKKIIEKVIYVVKEIANAYKRTNKKEYELIRLLTKRLENIKFKTKN